MCMALHIWRDFPRGAKMTKLTITPSLAFSLPHMFTFSLVNANVT